MNLRKGEAVPAVPSLASSPLAVPSRTPLEIRPLETARGSGECCKLPARSAAKPRPKTNLVHSKAARKTMVAMILNITSTMFYSRKIKI